LPELTHAHGERGGERARDDLAATAGTASLLRGEVPGGEGAADEPDGEPLRADARGRAGLTGAELEADELEASVEAESESERAGDGELALREPDTGDEPSATLAEAEPTLPVERTPPAPSWEQPSLFDDEPVDAYGTPLSLVEGRQGTGALVPEREVASAPAFAESDRVGEGEAGTAREREAATEAPFDGADEPELESPRADPIVLRDEDEPPAADAERDVVIEPRPRRLAVDEVIYRAGCLFLERKRVAVSMLQREFSLDFAAATAVLDQLQQLGLIGPYLGGQRRDILLTPEEWRERVGAP
jgi:DNA segregation ATPase FtsK/SpoIIIE-like protein